MNEHLFVFIWKKNKNSSLLRTWNDSWLKIREFIYLANIILVRAREDPI